MTSPGRRLRQAYAERPLILPGVFNALSARMAERLGFRAVYLSGGALSAGWAGVPDVGLLTLTEFVEQAAVLVRACSVPVVSDADTGFGEAIHVARCVQLFETAGVAAIHLEDQQLPKRCGHLTGKQLVDRSTMVSKIRAAVASRSDPDFVVIARTDARATEGLEAAIDRALAYVDAGADVIFPEALESPEEFARFAEAIPVPLLANMTEFGKSPLLDSTSLEQLGYRIILYPLTAFRVAMRAAADALRVLRDQGTQRDLIPRMLTRAELYDLLGYDDYEKADRAFFGGS
ncbi:MAG: methylisocitrate lyase [Isosphaeraceae bacterium]|jgi:methylisocitrate lyase|nr:MAG: methylisocitrate lyase [Isosphaeraceae bacterium]